MKTVDWDAYHSMSISTYIRSLPEMQIGWRETSVSKIKHLWRKCKEEGEIYALFMIMSQQKHLLSQSTLCLHSFQPIHRRRIPLSKSETRSGKEGLETKFSEKENYKRLATLTPDEPLLTSYPASFFIRQDRPPTYSTVSFSASAFGAASAASLLSSAFDTASAITVAFSISSPKP